MRFLSVTYRCYGPFDDVTLDVSQGNYGLHLIYGPNEAGKTTALRGMGHFLFGFPHNKCDDFRYSSSAQRIGAKLQSRHGNEVEFLRRRAKLNSLRTADDRTAIGDDVLREFLGGISDDQFTMLFGLNHHQLINGGHEILEGKGGLGEALFAAGAGLAGLRRLDQQLSDRSEELYKSQGQKQVIAVSIRNLHNKRDELRTKTLQIEAWLAQDQMLSDSLSSKTQLEHERTRNRLEMLRLEAYRFALPAIGALQELLVSLVALQDARLLDEHFAEKYRDTLANLLAARARRENLSQELQRLNGESRTIAPGGEILAEEQAIDRLREELGVCLKADSDSIGLRARLREHQGSARNVLRTYFTREDLGDVESLRLSPASEERIRTLGEERKALLQAVQDGEERLENCRSEIVGRTERLSATCRPPDLASLVSMVRSIESEGPLEKNERDATGKLAANRTKAEIAWKSLAVLTDGKLEQLLEVRIPPLERVYDYQHQFEQHQEVRRDLGKQHEKCLATIRERTRQIQRLERSGHVPSELELEQSRKDRDLGVELVRSALDQQTPEPSRSAAFIARHAPNQPLVDALQGSIHECDDLSDRMRREAQQVSELSLFQAEQRDAEQDRDRTLASMKAMEQQYLELQRNWQEQWMDSGVVPTLPNEMTAWMDRLKQLQIQIVELLAATESRNQQRQHIHQCKTKLRQALNLVDTNSSHSLVDLLSIAHQQIETTDQQTRARVELETQLADLRLSQHREELKTAQAKQRAADWQSSWGKAVSIIGLTADDEPTTANQYLRQLATIFREIREAGEIELRLAGIEHDRDQFLTRLNALRQRLHGHNNWQSTVETMQADVDTLVRQLNEEHRMNTQRKLLDLELARAKHLHEEADQTVVSLEAKLQAFREQANVDNEQDISLAIHRSDERSRLQVRVDEERAKLYQQARGQPLDEFLRGATEVRDQLEVRLADLQDGIEPLDQQINEQAVRAAAAQRKIEEWRQASAAAAECQQEIESQIAELHDQVNEYAALHLARQVLKLTIERFRQKHQGSMLSRAEHFFKLLTEGAFSSLEVDDNEDCQPVLVAVRASPSERVEMTGLSDGTRDQLFLALRLAGIEQHLKHREPMPLVVDDILVNFDADRARATLACLAELSQHTQILLFTHHAYLVTLAQQSIPSDVLFCHTLAGSSQSAVASRQSAVGSEKRATANELGLACVGGLNSFGLLRTPPAGGTTHCPLPTAHCPLPTADCRLPLVSLPTADCQLPTA